MQYLSVCSGIEAATVAWHPLDWEPVAFSEIDAFPAAVLSHHYQNTPNWGDMTRYKEWPDADVDVLVGGTPCQSFSVAGLRKGMDDPRGNLALVYLGIADHYRPKWVVWENVPGVLSSNGGRDFGAFLGGLGELGYGWAYRVLDAQYFGLAQRRNRVFVVASARGWQRAAAVLFESSSLRGDSAPSREAGQSAPTIPSRRTAGGGLGTDFDCDGGLIPERARALTTSNQRIDAETETLLVTHSLRAEGFDASEDGTGRGTPLVPVPHLDVMPTMMNGANTPAGHMARSGHSKDAYIVPIHAFDARQADVLQYGDKTGPLDTCGHSVAVAFAQNSRDELREMSVVGAWAAEPGMKQTSYIRQHMAVRRLTPRECERLQGFPDDYTLIQYRNKPAADGPRYKALGNSMAVPVMRWIGRRIQMVSNL